MHQQAYYTSSMNETIQSQSILPKSHQDLPKDTITHIEWMQDKPYFGVTSFDGCFRIYQISSRGNTGHFELVFLFQYAYPLLNFKFFNGFAFIGTANGKVLGIEIGNSQKIETEFKIIAEHSAPVFKIFFNNGDQKLISVDTKDTINIFDLKSNKLESTLKTKAPIQDCDFHFPLFVIALPDKQIQIMNFKNGGE